MFWERVGWCGAAEVRTSVGTNRCQLSQAAFPPSCHHLNFASGLHNCSCYVNSHHHHLPETLQRDRSVLQRCLPYMCSSTRTKLKSWAGTFEHTSSLKPNCSLNRHTGGTQLRFFFQRQREKTWNSQSKSFMELLHVRERLRLRSDLIGRLEPGCSQWQLMKVTARNSARRLRS